MSGPEPIAARILSSIKADPKERRDPYLADLGESRVTVHQANLVLIGTTSTSDETPVNVSIVTGMAWCCGCRRPGNALEYNPTPDQARLLARQLVEAADEVDAAAKASADAFIRKAAGR